MVGLSSEMIAKAAAALRGMGLLSEEATPQKVVEAAGQYASEGGPFRPQGLLGGVTEQVAGGIVNTPRSFGFTGDPSSDVRNMAQYLPTPMGAGPGGPRMAGAGVGGAGAAPVALRAPLPPGMVQEASRLDEKGNQWMEDPSMDGAEIDLTGMEESAQRYVDSGGDLPPGMDDVPGRVAEHVRRTSAGVQSMPQMYKDMGMPYDMAQHLKDVNLGLKQNAAAYAPAGSKVYVQGNKIRMIDPNPGEQFLLDYNKKFGRPYQHLTPQPAKVPVR